MIEFLISIREINASRYPRIDYRSLCSTRYTHDACHKENLNSISTLNLIEFRLIRINTDTRRHNQRLAINLCDQKSMINDRYFSFQRLPSSFTAIYSR